MSCQSRESSVALRGQSSCCEPAFTDHYVVLRDIREGGQGQVKLARHLLTGTEVAVKVLARVASNLPLLSEPDLMAGLDHPNVIHLFQVIETDHYIYLIMELAGGGDLWDLMPKTGGMQEEEARRLFVQILRAVQYCHQQGIVHLDLKPENVAVDASGNVKVIDFGLSTRSTAGEKLKRFFGTLLYVAPEMFGGQEFEGPPADVWSLGVVLYVMLTGGWPFEASSHSKLKRKIKRGKFDIPPPVSEGAQSLLRDILTVDPMHRPTLAQVMGHPWLTRAEEASPSPPRETLPRLPDPTILEAMVNLGYDHYHAWVSVASRKFSEDAMATYSILQCQRTQREVCEVQVEPEHRQGPEGLPKVCHKKFPSQPALPSPCGQQQPARSASVPAIPLSFLHEVTPPPSLASQPHPVPSRSPSQGTSPGPPRDSSRGWKRVRKRIAKCLRQLCCIPCFPRPRSRNRVAPGEMPSPDTQH